MDGFVYTMETIERIGKQFENEMDLSLNERFEESSLQMENTYIPELPDGTGELDDSKHLNRIECSQFHFYYL